MNVSVAGLFLAGCLPGIVMAVCLMGMVAIISSRKGYGAKQRFPGLKILLVNFLNGLPALLMPVIIMGGIMGGVFTPTRASAVAAIYGLIVGFVFYRTLKLKDLGPILRTTIRSTAMILFILAAARVFSWLITYTKLVDQATVVVRLLATVTLGRTRLTQCTANTSFRHLLRPQATADRCHGPTPSLRAYQFGRAASRRI